MFELVHMGHAHPLESTPNGEKLLVSSALRSILMCSEVMWYSCIINVFFFYIMKIAITVCLVQWVTVFREMWVAFR